MSPEQPPKMTKREMLEELRKLKAASEADREALAKEKNEGNTSSNAKTDTGSVGVPPPSAPANQPVKPEKFITQTPEEIENDLARAEYFQQMNAKYPKKDTPEMDEYWKELERKEEIYKATKRKMVGGFLAKE